MSVIHIFVILVCTAEAKLILQRNAQLVASEFETYANELVLGPPLSEIVFIDSHLEECINIADYFFKIAVDYMKIIDNGKFKNKEILLQTSTPEYTFVFMRNAESFQSTLANLPYHSFWYNRAPAHFIVCEPLDDWNFTSFMLRAIWRENIFNFVLVFRTDALHVRSFNIFSPHKFLELTHSSKDHRTMFPNKLRDVNGFRFRIGVFEIPRTEEMNKMRYEEDTKIIEDFVKYVNGSVDIVRLPDGSEGTEFKSVNFVLKRQFPTIENLNEVEFVRPLYKNSLVGMVPKAKLIPLSQYFHMIFKCDALVFFCSLVIIVAVIAGLGNNGQYIESFFEALDTFFNGSLTNFLQRRPSNKIIYISFMLFSLNVAVIFQTNLSSMLLTEKYYNNINTVNKLCSSTLTIFTDEHHYRLLPKCVQNKTIPISDKVLFSMLSKGTPHAYIALQSSILSAVQLQEDDDEPVRIFRHFHIMRETIVPGYTMYVFPETSPYVDQVAHFFEIYETMTSKFLLDDWRNINRMTRKIERIQWQHWKGIFSILICGYALSFAAFVIEIIVNKFNFYLTKAC